jgi:acetoin utilization deacetylase AcuC-like enzyme
VESFEKGEFKGDIESPAYPGIYEYAKLSAGAAILAAKIKGFSLMRPPGHHAGKNGKTPQASTLGFCYFNNEVIAVKSLGVPALIIDIDVHHGNGTEELVMVIKTFFSFHFIEEEFILELDTNATETALTISYLQTQQKKNIYRH